MIVHGVFWMFGSIIQARMSFGAYGEDKAKVGNTPPQAQPDQNKAYECSRMLMIAFRLIGWGFCLAGKYKFIVFC